LLAEQQRTWKASRFYHRLQPYQRLNADHSCNAAVSALISSQAGEQALQMWESSSGCCQAWQRLPLAVVRDRLKHPAAWLDGRTLRLSAKSELHDH
jgi:hypothetical protein